MYYDTKWTFEGRDFESYIMQFISVQKNLVNSKYLNIKIETDNIYVRSNDFYEKYLVEFWYIYPELFWDCPYECTYDAYRLDTFIFQSSTIGQIIASDYAHLGTYSLHLYFWAFL